VKYVVSTRGLRFSVVPIGGIVSLQYSNQIYDDRNAFYSIESWKGFYEVQAGDVILT
jgi:hypothetical protein